MVDTPADPHRSGDKDRDLSFLYRHPFRYYPFALRVQAGIQRQTQLRQLSSEPETEYQYRLLDTHGHLRRCRMYHTGIIRILEKPVKKDKAPRHCHHLPNIGDYLCFAQQYSLGKGGIGFHLSQTPVHFRPERYILKYFYCFLSYICTQAQGKNKDGKNKRRLQPSP